jgi:adenosyl cobinamide kinase/adenosyl cobinamide phosphate guanylyltransferase
MPIILGVDHERKQVDAVAVGPVTYADVENHLLAERYFGGTSYKEFVDARAAEARWTAREAQKIAELIRKLAAESKFGPTAVLVSNEVTFGMLRMLEILLEDTAELKPFRSEDEARAWLAPK